MPPRKAHVIRIWENPSDKSGKWIDVLRVDRFDGLRNAGGQVQTHHFKWEDDSSDGTGESANGQRTMETVTVKDSDGDDLLDVPAVKKMMTMNSDQRAYRHFANDKNTNNTRRVVNVKVYPVDIGDTDPTTPMDWESYKSALGSGTKDTSKYLTMAVPERWYTNEQQGYDYQGAFRHLRHKLDITDELDNMEVTEDDANATWLDPFQIIVNWTPDDKPTPGLRYVGLGTTLGDVSIVGPPNSITIGDYRQTGSGNGWTFGNIYFSSDGGVTKVLAYSGIGITVEGVPGNVTIGPHPPGTGFGLPDDAITSGGGATLRGTPHLYVDATGEDLGAADTASFDYSGVILTHVDIYMPSGSLTPDSFEVFTSGDGQAYLFVYFLVP